MYFNNMKLLYIISWAMNRTLPLPGSTIVLLLKL